MAKSSRRTYWIDADTPWGSDDDGNPTLGPLVFDRRKNPHGLVPTTIEADDHSGKAIRLAVDPEAPAGDLLVPGDVVNDRCELREIDKSLIGEEVWYGFSIRIPPKFPRRPLRCVVAQIKIPYDDDGNGSPAFSLRVDDGQWVATVEHLYEPMDARDHRYLSAAVGGQCGVPAAPAYDHHDFSDVADLRDLQVRALLATDAAGLPPHLARYEFTKCTTGVTLATYGRLPEADGRWSDFIVRFASSGRKDHDGTIELYADGQPVAIARGEFGYAKTIEKKQYFKIGLYRNHDADWGSGTTAIEVRDIRRGQSKRDVDLSPQRSRPKRAPPAA